MRASARKKSYFIPNEYNFRLFFFFFSPRTIKGFKKILLFRIPVHCGPRLEICDFRVYKPIEYCGLLVVVYRYPVGGAVNRLYSFDYFFFFSLLNPRAIQNIRTFAGYQNIFTWATAHCSHVSKNNEKKKKHVLYCILEFAGCNWTHSTGGAR